MEKVERTMEWGMDGGSVKEWRQGGRERKPAVLNPEETTMRMSNQCRDR